MITLIPASDQDQFAREIDSMHRLRAKIFHDRMKWPVIVSDGGERDHFDTLNPLYVVGSTDGQVYACARLLPTTGPNMLRDVFPDLLPSGGVSGPTIWESSRFCVDFEGDCERSDLLVSQRTAELLSGIVEAGLLIGLEYVVTVVDVAVERVLRRAGCPCERLGPPRRIGRSLAIAGMFAMGNDLLASIRKAGDIQGEIIDLRNRSKIPHAA